jgi:prepilin-type N-terminal cleavage/methylation domain-containing protein
MRYSTTKQSAFTLIELSLVLVIIGLLVGGIIAGQSLIRASEIRSVTTALGKYNSAVNLFQSEFKALPGDMPNASTYWGAADGGSGSTPACFTTVSGKQATCNGNGDGQISDGGLGGQRYEIYRAWQHLANAGMIEGSYSGVARTGTNNGSIPGTNTPAGKVPGSGYDFWYSSGGTTATGNAITFGSTDINGDISVWPILVATDAESIDKKLDDGLPGTGMIVTFANGNMWDPNCATADASPVYNVQLTTAACSLLLIIGY